MRRWNGWGDATIRVPLSPATLPLLVHLLGPGVPPTDVTLEAVAAKVPAGHLPIHPLVTTDPVDRVYHARGQSFPDLIAMRSGEISVFPDGVAYPIDDADIRALLAYAKDVGAHLIPYGGGTSVVGHINPQPGDAPVLTVDLGRMNRLLHIEEENRLATFGAGVSGPDLEAQLRARGYTLGHFPQSFERSTLGGWIATRSKGQQALGYGRIEDLFAGGQLETPLGTLPIQPFPAAATGPDLREMVLGSEGRFGILSKAIVRMTPFPQHEAFHAVFFPNWEHACTAVRTMVQDEIPLSMLRLSTPKETEMNLSLAGHQRFLAAFFKLLALRQIGKERCMLLIGITGPERSVATSRQLALAVAAAHGGVHGGRIFGRAWQKSRFLTPYLRNELWERGYGVDTVETATTWSKVPAMITAIEEALTRGLAACGEQVHAFTHISHVYRQGSSVYTTFLFRLGANAEETYQRWLRLKRAASQAILTQGGTISHQHGIGADHRSYLTAEKGELGVAAIRQLAATFDPTGLLNPGKLV